MVNELLYEFGVDDDMIVSKDDRTMSHTTTAVHPVLARRNAREWSQAELAKRAGISRAAVSSIEGERLTPSVTTALSLAAVLECSVEELFGRPAAAVPGEPEWAWGPRAGSCRYWEAEVNRRRLLYPVEGSWVHPIPHDGVWSEGLCRESAVAPAETTLTLASCDPAAGLLAEEYARTSGFRLLVFPRSGMPSMFLLKCYCILASLP